MVAQPSSMAARPTATSSVTILGAFGGAEEEDFNASLAEFEEAAASTSQYTADQDFTTTIKQKVNSGDAPDIGLFPQPGGLLELAGQDKIEPIDTYLDYDKLEETLVPGFLDAGQLQRPRLRRARCGWPSRASSGTPKAVRRGRATPPSRRRSRSCGPTSPSKIAATGIDPVVHGLGVRPGHRLGRHRLARGVHAAHVAVRTSTTSGSRTRSRSTTRAIVEAFDDFGELAKDPKHGARRRRGRAQHAVRRRDDCRPSTTRRSAACSARATSSPASTRRTCRPTSTTRSAVYVFPPLEGGYDGSRSSAAVTSPRSSTATTRTPRR